MICVGAWMTVIRVWERGRRAILQRGEAKRVASRNLVSRLSVVPFLSPCACCPVIRLIKATYRQRRHVHATVLTHVENKLSLMYGLKPAELQLSLANAGESLKWRNSILSRRLTYKVTRVQMQKDTESSPHSENPLSRLQPLQYRRKAKASHAFEISWWYIYYFICVRKHLHREAYRCVV